MPAIEAFAQPQAYPQFFAPPTFRPGPGPFPQGFAPPMPEEPPRESAWGRLTRFVERFIPQREPAAVEAPTPLFGAFPMTRAQIGEAEPYIRAGLERQLVELGEASQECCPG